MRLSPWAIKMLEAFLPPFAVAHAVVGEAEQDGWRTITLPVGPVRHAAYELLRFGAEAEVLAPEALRVQVGRIATALAQRYGTTHDTALDDGRAAVSEVGAQGGACGW